MAEVKCENCSFRAKYDNNHNSFLGKVWKWHASWCPGWKSYMASLPKDKQNELAQKYGMEKYLAQK